MTPLQKELTRAFNITALLALTGIASVFVLTRNPPSAPDAAQPADDFDAHAYAPPRRLCEDEKTLVRSIFGDGIDMSQVTLHFGPPLKAGQPKQGEQSLDKIIALTTFNGTTLDNDIQFFGRENMSDNYARNKKISLYGDFIHEMTHVYQNQHHVITFDSNQDYRARTYIYKFSDHRSYFGFGVEQQAAIMEDYGRRFLYPGPGRTTDWLAQSHSGDTPQTDALLRNLVEAAFPEAAKTRAALPLQSLAEAEGIEMLHGQGFVRGIAQGNISVPKGMTVIVSGTVHGNMVAAEKSDVEISTGATVVGDILVNAQASLDVWGDVTGKVLNRGGDVTIHSGAHVHMAKGSDLSKVVDARKHHRHPRA